jgi:ribosomal protein L29
MRKELLTEYTKLSAGGVAENAGKLSEMKKTIARIKTIGGIKGYKING